MGSAVKAWDFTQARELASSLAASPAGTATTTAAEEPSSAAQKTSNVVLTGEQLEQAIESPRVLGDFRRVFYFLGTPDHDPHSRTDTNPDTLIRKLDYSSDGAVYLGAKPVLSTRDGLRDETDIDEGNIATDRSASPPQTPTGKSASQALSKKARQRRNRRMRQEALSASGHKQKQQTTVSDSEADAAFERTPAKKASIHTLSGASPTRARLQSRASSTSNLSSIGSGVKRAETRANTEARSSVKHDRNGLLSPILDERLSEPSPHPTHESSTPLSHKKNTPAHLPNQPTPTTPNRTPIRFAPASILPSPPKVPSCSLPQQISTPSIIQTTQTRGNILPLVARSEKDRHLALFLKLLKDFDDDAKHLVAPMNLTTHNNHPNGIHVFVDASNIFIGFMDVLKRARGIAQHTRISQKEPSFSALALLMEHRRPVAKRILVGSGPETVAFRDARSVGYECNILERVWKQRQLTERQIFFRDRDAGLIPRGKKPPQHGNTGDSNGYSTSSDTATPQYGPRAFVEQGVDEILHMKIMESIIDFPPSTMIVATGDAAQAEYSDGFKAVVERALNKGWNVELMSWSKNISYQYTDNRFRQKWGLQLKIVALDDYAEELLDE